MTKSNTTWQRCKLGLLFALALIAQPSGYVSAQIDTSAVTSMVQQLLLAECPIATEPPLQVCTPPVLETQAHIDAFQAVEVVKGHLQIEAATNLDFSPLNNLREIQGILYLHQGQLSTINGFNNLESIGARASLFGNGHQIYIENNPNLTSISGFNKLRKATHPAARSPAIFIRHNPALNQINGFSMLDQAAVVSIRRNSLLSSVSGFDALHTIDSGIGLIISNSAVLTNIPSFANLSVINGALQLYDLPSLTTMPRFQALTAATRVRIHNLGIADLQSFNNSGFNGTSSLEITENRNLTLISGFASLVNIAGARGDLYISDNPLLDNVTGFNSFINGDPTDYISIADNPQLDCPTELFMLQPVAYSQNNDVNCTTTPYPF